jgi:hypothetical protein
MAAAVVGHNTDVVPDYPPTAGKGDISGIILERASFLGTSEDDLGNVWLVDTGGNPLCRSGRIPALTNAPGIRQLLAVDEYYLESDAARERLNLDDIRVRALENGGFTYNPLYGATPQHGYAVSLHGHGKIIDPGTFTDDKLLKYLQENGEQMKDPARYIGGWIDDGRLYLDVSIVLQDEKEARKTGRVNGQTSIFDMGTNETVYLKDTDGKWLIDASGNWLSGTDGEHDLSKTEESLQGNLMYNFNCLYPIKKSINNVVSGII